MQQSINPLAGAQQVRQKSYQRNLAIARRSIGRRQIRPSGWNVGTGAIWQNQHQIKSALALDLAEYLENLARQRVVRTCDPDLCGKVSEGGSVSCVSSTRF